MNDLNNVFSTEYICSDRGKGVRILKDFQPNDTIFKEKPLFSYVHYYTRKSTLVCDNCSTSIGSLLDNLNHVLKIEKRSISNSLYENINNLKTKFPELEGIKPIKCEMNCDFIFCSQECLESSNNIHKFLCQLMDSQEVHEWREFERYSLKTHENFYFAGLIYINILYDSLYDKKNVKEWIDKLNEFCNKRWDEMYTLNSYSKNTYDIAYNSFYMLESCLKRFKKHLLDKDKDIDKLFELDFYLRLLGMMDLVCVDIEIPNPLNTLLYNLKQDENGSELIEKLSEDLERVYRIINGIYFVDEKYVYNLISQDLKNIIGNIDDLVDISNLIDCYDVFPHILGLGLFNFISKMNHSCDPNLEVEYINDNTANINSLTQIFNGDEATISYINENDTFEKRQKLLFKNYGFKCKCTKCILEGSRKDLENKN